MLVKVATEDFSQEDLKDVLQLENENEVIE